MKKFFIVFLTSFLLWFVFSLFIGKNEFYVLWKTQNYTSEILTQTPLNLDDFWAVYWTIEEEFFSEDKVEKQKLVEGAIKWMVDSLWDIHSEFMSPEITEKFEASLRGDFEWIGAEIKKVPLWVRVERLIKWSPAKKYGVRSGDIIIKSNDIPLEDLDVYDAIDKIKWPAGTHAVLEIIRPGEEKILTIDVTRAKIQIPSVEEEYFEEENLAYIALNMYGQTTSSEFKKALDNVRESNADGLIIDVRDNGWGYLLSAVEILSEFIEKDKLIVETKYKKWFSNERYESYGSDELYDKKIIVLINGNSASASEITAWVLRDYDKAILVWETSYGKWSVQTQFDFVNGSRLKLTVAKWYTPAWDNVNLDGINPDITVEFTQEDFENSYDRQLEEAKKILQIFIEKETIWLTLEEYGQSENITEL